MSDIPSGYCQCGCGNKTKPCPETDTSKGWVKGEPQKFLRFHHLRLRHRPLEERFWSYVEKTDGCWIWRGAKNSPGYGVIARGGKGEGMIGAHRLSYELAYGLIPVGKFVCHKCDNPSCVRPDHLFVGTQSDNITDASRKGRLKIHRGENAKSSKLTKNQVIEIRHRYAQGNISQAQLAKDYPVGRSLIGLIIQRKRWAHI